jgi:hypothetical protein
VRTCVSFIITAGPLQRSDSRVRVPRDSWPYFTVSDSRLPQPGWPGLRIYIPQEQVGPIIPPCTGFPFRCLLWLAGIRTRLHAENVLFCTYKRDCLVVSFDTVQHWKGIGQRRTSKISVEFLTVASNSLSQKLFCWLLWDLFVYSIIKSENSISRENNVQMLI